MRDKRNKLVAAMDAFLETHYDTNGALSEADDATYKGMEAEVASITDSIRRLERREDLEAELSKPASKPLTGQPMQAEAEVKTGRASEEYRQAMLRALRTNFRQVSNVLQEGVDADGGYLVPDEYDSRLIRKLEEENVMRKLAHQDLGSAQDQHRGDHSRCGVDRRRRSAHVRRRNLLSDQPRRAQAARGDQGNRGAAVRQHVRP